MNEAEFAARLAERLNETAPEETPDTQPVAADEATPTDGEAVTEPTATEETTTTEETGDSRPRDAHGRFTSTKADEPAEEQPDDDLLMEKAQDVLEKYGNDPEKVAAAYAALQRKLGEQGREVGTSRTEVQQLREELAEMRGAMSTLSTAATGDPYPVTDALIEWADEAAAENPHEAAVWALQHQPKILQRIVDGWWEHDARGAARFERTLETAAIRQEMEKLREPIQRAEVTDAFTHAWKNVADRLPDLNKFADAIVEAAEAAPEVMSALQRGDLPTQARVIENLYWMAKGRNSDTLIEARVQAARQAEEEARTAKANAVVVSNSSTPDRGAATPLEAWRTEFRKAAGLLPRDAQ